MLGDRPINSGVHTEDPTRLHVSSGLYPALGLLCEQSSGLESFGEVLRGVLRVALREFDLSGLEVEVEVEVVGPVEVFEGEVREQEVVFRMPRSDSVSGAVRVFIPEMETLSGEAKDAIAAVSSTVSLALSNLSLRKSLAAQKAHLSVVQLASEALGSMFDEQRIYSTVLLLALELQSSAAGVIFPGGDQPPVALGFEDHPAALAELERADLQGRKSWRGTVEGGGAVGAAIRRTGGAFFLFRDGRTFTAADESILRLVCRQLAQARERSRLHSSLENATLEMTESLAAALESRDGITGRHISRTQELVEAVAHALELAPAKVRAARFAAVLHDVGKIGVPDAILNKPGKLDEREWEVMRRHPATGARILRGISGFERVAEAVATHHERFDGGGYPSGVAGEDIPVEARIISVVDSYDAMTNDRPYRRALSHGEAVAELERGAGSQFDPRVVEILNSLFKDTEDNRVQEV